MKSVLLCVLFRKASGRGVEGEAFAVLEGCISEKYYTRQVKGWWWGQHSLKLHGREADDIAARAKIDFILGVELDVSIGNQGRVQGQGKSRRYALLVHV